MTPTLADRPIQLKYNQTTRRSAGTMTPGHKLMQLKYNQITRMSAGTMTLGHRLIQLKYNQTRRRSAGTMPKATVPEETLVNFSTRAVRMEPSLQLGAPKGRYQRVLVKARAGKATKTTEM